MVVTEDALETIIKASDQYLYVPLFKAQKDCLNVSYSIVYVLYAKLHNAKLHNPFEMCNFRSPNWHIFMIY